MRHNTMTSDQFPIPFAPVRARCERCLRPRSACICAWIDPVAGATSLLILQHPMEVAHAKGSARLLHLSVAGSVMVTGEVFEPRALHALLHGDGRVPLLLYPALAGERALGVPAPPALLALDDPAQLRLVVLDGTWRKSRKMLFQNPLLHALPRFPLTEAPATHYAIRKAHAPDQLSTLEASCLALARLEQAPQRYARLLERFDDFVACYQATGGRLAR